MAKEDAPRPGKLEFRAKIYAAVEGKDWTFVDLPANSAEVLGSQARVAVRGTINGFFFRSSVMPTGRGNHQLMVNRAMKLGSKAQAGDEVDLVLEKDLSQRTLEVPADLLAAVSANRDAQERWERFSFSHKKSYVDWVESAKKPETRLERISKAVGMIAEGKSVK